MSSGSPASAWGPLLQDDSVAVMQVVCWVTGCGGTGVVGDQLQERANWVQGGVNATVRRNGFNKPDLLNYVEIVY